MKALQLAAVFLVASTAHAQQIEKKALGKTNDAPAVAEALKCIESFGGSGNKGADVAAKAAADIGKALTDGRITKGKGMGIQNASTGGVGADPLKKDTIINANLFEPNSMPGIHCSGDFIELANVLLHEGSFYRKSLQLDPLPEDEPPGTARLAKYLHKISLECLAYEADIAYKEALQVQILNLKAGKKLDAWAEKCFGECKGKEQGIQSIIDYLEDRLPKIRGYAKALHKYTDKDCNPLTFSDAIKNKDVLEGLEKAKKDKTPEGLSDFIKDVDDVGSIIGLRARLVDPGDGLPFSVSFESLKGTFSIGSDSIQTGVAHPQDVVVFDDATGRTWMLVAGNSSLAGPGIVRALRLEVFMSRVQIAEGRTIEDDDTLRFVTSIARRDDGKTYVMVRNPAALHLLLDDDSDGVPDRVGPPSAQLPTESVMREFVALQASGAFFSAQLRSVVIANGNEPYLALEDSQGDGFYETHAVRFPSQSPTRPPSWLGEPVGGAVTIGAAGTHGHQFVILAIQGNQQIPIGQGTFPQLPSDEAIIQLSRPLQEGEEIALRDMTNGIESGRRIVAASRPELYQLGPEFAVPKEQTQVTLNGTGFQLVREVRIGGKPTEFISRTNGQVVVLTAKLGNEHAWEVEFILEDDSIVSSPFELNRRPKP